ncbi:hypothetical protein [Thalassospira marina]|uniref:Portal protein n=1 Tax=Thalassospira marina TaxID=2048283 RepID=A0A2N3KY49_9PROT|nr:hypothetical protein [Thalassospira marina]PKR55410.1 hypothetical protein COO20_04365 [Thalassospira marina]
MDDHGEMLKPGSDRYWEAQLEMSERREQEFRQNGEKVVQRYKAERPTTGTKSSRMNILYSNTETLKGALYGKTAKPDARRRYHDADPVGKQTAEVLERALAFVTDDPDVDVDSDIEAAIQDRLLPGRGVVRVVYRPVIAEMEQSTLGLDEEGTEAVSTEMVEYVADQRIEFHHVYWKDYRQGQARNWRDVPWVAFRHEKTTEEMVADGIDEAIAKSVPKNSKPDDCSEEDRNLLAKAEVWEIWCKETRKRYWYVKGFKVLKSDDDPYGLSGFFPVPAPLLAVTTSDSLIPVPDYHEYEDQAEELDRITTRINRLVDALRRRGIYNSEIDDGVLSKLATAKDNQFIPVKNWAQFVQTGGMQTAFQNEDISPIMAVVSGLYEQRATLIQSIYEITGISDVIRGSSNPNETATAQRLKGQFGSMRLQKQQKAVAKFVRDLYRIAAELIAEHFEPEVLSRMTGIQVDGQMIAIMRDDKLRGFRVDIETDSTVFEDAEAEKQSAVELVSAVTQFLGQAAQLSGAVPEMTPLMFDLLSMTVRRFKGGRQIEDTIDQTRNQIMARLQQQQSQPPVNPEMEKLKQEGQIKQAEMHQDGQLEIRKQNQEFELKKREQDMDTRIELFKAAGQGMM